MPCCRCAWLLLSGRPALKVELRPVRAALPAEHPGGASDVVAWPPARFAHSAAVMQQEGGGVEMAIFGGVTQTDDLNDVALWTL